MPLAALYFGVLFFGGISPSKISQIAPFLATIQALSKARVILQVESTPGWFVWGAPPLQTGAIIKNRKITI
jgi:hypothetical protein